MAASQRLFTQVTKDNKKMLEGVHEMCEVVGSTMGPLGTNVAINKTWDHTVIHDGVGVAKSVLFEDPQKDLGARIVREAAQKQVQEVGDGTTAVMVLSDAIVSQAEQMISTGVKRMAIRRELEDGKEKLIKEISKLGKKIKTREDVIKIAAISAENEELGKLIGDTVYKMGVDGVVQIEPSKSQDTWVDYQEGMQFDTGYFSPYFITDVETMTAGMENPYIWITNEPITSINDCLPFIEKITKVTKSLVVIAPEITIDPLSAFIETKVKGGMNIICIRAPLFNNHQSNFLQDIAILTGGQVISPSSGIMYDSAEVSMLGRCDFISATQMSTTIIGGSGKKKDVNAHVKGLKTLLATQTVPFDQEKTKERIAKLTSGVAVIRVGGHTEIEMKERTERVDDAVNATKAALRSGIVAGGETIYLKIRKVLGKTPGEQILFKALEKPFRILVENAGFDSGKLLHIIEMWENEIDNVGFDVTKDETPIDLLKNDIVDPLEVPRQALANSVSVSIQLITTGYTVAPEKYD